MMKMQKLRFAFLKLKFLICFVLISIITDQDYLFCQNDCGYQFLPNNCNPSIISKVTNVWYFGKHAGLNFNTVPPTIINCSLINQLEGGASISDLSGNFLFSTNGQIMNLINNNLRTIPNSDNLFGHYSATQNSIIVPSSGAVNHYYVFTVGVNLPDPYGHGLNYSIVKISENDSVIEKNTSILSAVTEKITAVKHDNEKDVWIIVHEWNSKRFYSYLLTENGLQPPVTSEIGTEHTKDAFNNNAIGCLKASPDGCKLALAIYGKSIIEIFDFDKTTGNITNAITSDPIFNGAYGIEFSTDSKMLYLSTNDYSLPLPFNSTLTQFSIEDGISIFNNPILITSDSIIDYLGLQLALDGKIYVASSIREQLPLNGYDYVSVIHNPTRRGSCNFNFINYLIDKGVFLNGGKCRIGLPNFIQSYFYIPKFIYSHNCLQDNTNFKIINTTNVDSVLWDFGDGNNSTGFNPTNIFLHPGEYSVKLTDYFNGIGYTDSLQVLINPLPSIVINNDIDTIVFIAGEKIHLTATPGFESYLWSNGSDQDNIIVENEGYYFVTVSNKNCCFKTDSIYLQKFFLVVPNAFIPSSTGIDASFKVLDIFNMVVDYSISIYNEFGNVVYKSTDIKSSWNGEKYSMGVYKFYISFRLKNNKSGSLQGDVTLIR